MEVGQTGDKEKEATGAMTEAEGCPSLGEGVSLGVTLHTEAQSSSPFTDSANVGHQLYVRYRDVVSPPESFQSVWETDKLRADGYKQSRRVLSELRERWGTG